MDKINFLITEVSLECLGNKFFDVYGKQTESLLRLISVNSLKPEPTDNDSETDLWKSLTAPKKRARITFENQRSNNEPQRKRRASFSITNNEAEGNNDSESLLVPMPPKAAKIMNRRSTISVQLAKQNRKHLMSNQMLKHPKQIVECIQINDTSPTKVRKQTFVSNKSFQEIQQHLKIDTDARKFPFCL